MVEKFIRKKVVFFKYDLVKDEPVESFNIIICQNVMIYFNYYLKYKVMGKFDKALKPLGFFILGENELILDDFEKRYKEIELHSKIYQKIG